jgi:hypothetical protein
LSLPEAARQAFGGRDAIRFLAVGTGESSDGVERLTMDSPLVSWLVGQMQHLGPVVHAVPRGQPTSVRQLAPRLFQPYTVERGTVHLGGCTFEEQPLLRYTFRVTTEAGASAPRLVDVFRNPDGEPVDGDLLTALHVDDLEPRPGRPPKLGREQGTYWHSLASHFAPPSTVGQHAELLVVTAVWCRYVHAKLLFEIGQQQAELRFQGWAQLLAEGRVTPPPYACPDTGLASFQLAATDDGRITVREAIGVCEQSGRRVLQTQLGTCELTGRRLLTSYLTMCPVTGRRIARAEMVTCAMCRQSVSPTCVSHARCQACRNLAVAPAGEPRLARVLGEYPRLNRWSHWRIAETATAYILTSAYFFYRLLLVIDKESLAIWRMAEGPRLAGRWTDVPEDQWPEYLG